MSIDLKQLFAKLRIKGSPREGKDPFRDWKIIIVGFLALNLAAILGSLYVFWMINSGKMFDAESKGNVEVESLNMGDLASIIEIFNKRSIDLAGIKAEQEIFVDPSL